MAYGFNDDKTKFSDVFKVFTFNTTSAYTPVPVSRSTYVEADISDVVGTDYVPVIIKELLIDDGTTNGAVALVGWLLDDIADSQTINGRLIANVKNLTVSPQSVAISGKVIAVHKSLYNGEL